MNESNHSHSYDAIERMTPEGQALVKKVEKADGVSIEIRQMNWSPTEWKPDMSRTFETGRMSERYLRIMGASAIVIGGVSEAISRSDHLLHAAIIGIGALSLGAGQWIKSDLDKIESHYDNL